MAGRRRGGFSFDLFQPIKKGVLLKQGAVHTAFKYRFFVLYPGFFVYYEKESKWRQDLTKGETLDSRIGAIKLIGGNCGFARSPPKGCKFGFTIHAPDPLNKRPTYLINATSKQDRDEWIEAIRRATPNMSQNQQKRDKEVEPIARSQPPPSASPAVSRPYTPPAPPAPPAPPLPPSIDKGRSNGRDNWSSGGAPPSPWQNTETAPKRPQPTPVMPPRPPMRQVPTPVPPPVPPPIPPPVPPPINSQPTRRQSDDVSSIQSKPLPAMPWQQEAPKRPMPIPGRSKTPTRQFPAEIAAIMDKGESRRSASPKSDGEPWIKALRKSTTTSPGRSQGSPKPVTSRYPGAAESADSGPGGWSKAGNKSQRGSGSPLRSNKKPLPPPPPPPEDPSSVYVNLDDLDDGVESSSDDDSYPLSASQQGLMPVNFDTFMREMRASASQVFVEKKGYLYKLGTKERVWNLRYFVLRPGVFTYAKDPQGKVTEVVKLKKLQVFYPGPAERRTSFQFMIHTESTWNKRADWLVAAQSESDMKEWILAFKLASQNTL